MHTFGLYSLFGDCFLSISKDVVGSGLHDTSNAETHAHDVRELFDSKEVANKPILLMETDGATVIKY